MNARISHPKVDQKTKHLYPTTQIKLERGIRLLPIRPDRASKYGVIWGPDRRSAHFRSMEELERKITELNDAVRKGTVSMVPSKNEIAEWRAFRAAVGPVPMLDVIAGWKAWRESQGKPVCELTVMQAVDDYITSQEKRLENGQITKDTMRQKKCKLVRFRDKFCLSKLDEVKGTDIEEWLDDDDDMQEIVKTAETFNDHVRKIAEVYSHYHKLVAESPTADIEKRDDLHTHVRVMPVPDVAKLFLYAKDNCPAILPRLSCEYFLGLRFATASRLKKENFNLETGSLSIQKSILKTRKDRYLDGAALPANWIHWVRLGWDHQEGWDWDASQYMHAKSNLFKDSEVTAIHNSARHTFATRHTNGFSNPGLTATILMHRNQQMLWDTYFGRGTKAEGIAHFKITPRTVVSYAKAWVKGLGPTR